MVQPAKKDYEYRVVSKTKSNLTTVLYLHGATFEEAAKKRAKLGLTEPAMDMANVYRAERKDAKTANETTILIGTVTNNKITYENIFDRVKEGLEHLTDSFLFDHNSPTKTEKEVVKTIAKRVAMVHPVPVVQFEGLPCIHEIYKIKLKIVL
jgi:hypothetical protein